MITIVILYLLIYALVFAYMRPSAADVGVSTSRARCSGTGSGRRLDKIARYVTSKVQPDGCTNTTFAAYSLMIGALVCMCAQFLCLVVTLFVVKFVLAIVGTLMIVFDGRFARERLFTLPGIVGVLYEVLQINVDGTDRGAFMHDFREVVMTDWKHVLMFNAINCAFGGFLRMCLGRLKGPTTSADATLVRYSGLTFGIANFVFSFTGAACEIFTR